MDDLVPADPLVGQQHDPRTHRQAGLQRRRCRRQRRRWDRRDNQTLSAYSVWLSTVVKNILPAATAGEL